MMQTRMDRQSITRDNRILSISRIKYKYQNIIINF
jgi:hypothetical protein